MAALVMETAEFTSEDRFIATELAKLGYNGAAATPELADADDAVVAIVTQDRALSHEDLQAALWVAKHYNLDWAFITGTANQAGRGPAVETLRAHLGLPAYVDETPSETGESFEDFLEGHDQAR